MFTKYIAKIFALEPAATAVERGVIAAILMTALVCLALGLSDSVTGLYASTHTPPVVSTH
jgi:Flp pilus assembly pilin Flp